MGVVLFGNSGKGGFIIISDGGWVNKKMNQPCFSQMKTVFTVLSAHFPHKIFLKNSEVNWKSKQSSLLSLFINQNKLLHLNRKGFHRNFRKWNNTADGGILPYNLLVCAYMHIATMVFPQSLETVRIVLCIT